MEQVKSEQPVLIVIARFVVDFRQVYILSLHIKLGVWLVLQEHNIVNYSMNSLWLFVLLGSARYS